MRKVVIYNASWGTYGGGEKYSCTVADTLGSVEGMTVTLLLDNEAITRERIARHFNLTLRGVQLLHVDRDEVRSHLREADIGIVLSNFRSLGNLARLNVSLLQIPYARITPITMLMKGVRERPREAIKDLLRLQLLRDARKAHLVLVNSAFTQRKLQTHHAVHSEVLYPPIEDFANGTKKKHVVLSVGRFFTGLYNDKRYDVLIETFKHVAHLLPGWEYRIVGSCGSDRASQHYFAQLKHATEGSPIFLYPNASYRDLRHHYNEATLFWHAAGFGSDEELFPERMEHFGMSTAEAMSAGCVPIVINAGGQKEIVSHGVSGYLWRTLDELVAYTRSTISEPERLTSLQAQARARYESFCRREFSARLISLITALSKRAS